MERKIKVLQVITGLKTGGAEKLLVDSVKIYKEAGIEMDVLAIDGTPSPFRSILENQVNCRVFGLTKKSVYNPLLIFKIIPYLHKYDVLHVHLFPALYWVALAKVFSFSNVKMIYTEHSTSNRRRNSKIFKILDRVLYRLYDRIVTIANEVDSELKRHLKFKDDRFILIENGIDLNFFTKASSYNKSEFFSDSDLILIQISSFRFPKDQPTLIRSLTRLPDNIKLLLVGDGPLRESCEDLVEELGLQTRVKFLGIRMDVSRLLKTVDIVVLSSFHEGLSLASIEGMACGKPFIASDVPGLREIVTNAGLLFEASNEQQLAQLILKLVNDKSFYQNIIDRCLNKAHEFDIKKMVSKYVNVYQELQGNS